MIAIQLHVIDSLNYFYKLSKLLILAREFYLLLFLLIGKTNANFISLVLD